MGKNREKIFRFKQFAVANDRAAMKVGTDGVLLGAWAPVKPSDRVLDVGTGCGLIALMLAQRAENASILAIDIDTEAVTEATENFANSPWGNRLTARVCDFNSLSFSTEEHPFSLIVSNPPYFENALTCPDEARSNARHDTSLSFRTIIRCASDLLCPGGSLCLVLPAECESAVVSEAEAVHAQVAQICRVFSTTAETQPKRILVQLIYHSPTPVSTQLSEFAIEISRHNYTPQYIALTRDFYLKM